MPSAGNRVRTVDNERLDKNDFDAIFSLIYAWSQYAQGMGMGVGEGVLSPPSVTYEAGPPRVIRLGECTLYAAQNDGAATNRAQAYPVNYNPTDPNQLQTTVDITAFSNAEGVLWWTVDLVDAELDNRRVWEAGYPDGRAVAMLTRQSQRVRFTTSADFDTAPATPGTWFRAGAFFLPTSGAPTVVWCHAFDFGFNKDIDGSVGAGADLTRWIGQWIFQTGYDTSNNVGRSFGLARMLSQLAMRVLTMIDSDYTFDPETLEILTDGTESFVDQPARGLVQLDADLTAAETTVDALELRYRNAYWAYIADTASVTNEGGDAYDAGILPTWSDGGTGVYNVSFSSALAASSGDIQIMHCPNDSGSPNSFTRAIISSTTTMTVFTYNSSGTLADRAFRCSITAKSTAY